jgi:hypothetical protein
VRGNRIFAQLILCLIAAVAAFAQNQRQSQPPATPHNILLPPVLVAGEPATLAVITLDGRIAPFAAVNLPNGKQVITDEAGRARFMASSASGAFLAKLPGSDQMAAAAVVDTASSSQLMIQHAPRFVSLHAYFPIYGTGFRGEADQDVVSVGGVFAVVLASSPVSLVVVPAPETPVGTENVAVQVGGNARADTLSVVDLRLFTDTTEIIPGKKIGVTVQALGTERPLELEIRNLSPAIIKLPDRSSLRIRTSGGPENAARFSMQGIAAGTFSLAANLVARSGPPDIIAAGQFIQAAASITTPQIQRQLFGIDRRIQKHPKEAQKAIADLEKLPAGSTDHEFAFWIDAAIDSLRGEQ